MQFNDTFIKIGVFVLAVALINLLFSACTNADNPTPSPNSTIVPGKTSSVLEAAQSPVVVTPPVTPLQKGKMKEVFPALANLENDILSIAVEYDNSHYHTSQVFYKLERKGNNFEGEVMYRADNDRNRRTAPSSIEISLTKKVTLPFDVILKHIQSINETNIELGNYLGKPVTTYVTGSDLYLSLTITTSTGKLFLTNQAVFYKHPFILPLGGEYNSKTFFIEDNKGVLAIIPFLNSYADANSILQTLYQQYKEKKNFVTP
jgi:hypothetical protein